jgi:hypothetical protein
MQSTPATPPIDAVEWGDIVELIDSMIAELPGDMKGMCMVELLQQMQARDKSEPFVRKRKPSCDSSSRARSSTHHYDAIDCEVDNNTDVDNANDESNAPTDDDDDMCDDDMHGETVEAEPHEELSNTAVALYEPSPAKDLTATTPPARRDQKSPTSVRAFSVQCMMSEAKPLRRMSTKTPPSVRAFSVQCMMSEEKPFPQKFKSSCNALAVKWDAVLAAELSSINIGTIDSPSAAHLRYFDFWVKLVVLQYYEEYTVLPHPDVLLDYFPDAVSGMSEVVSEK